MALLVMFINKRRALAIQKALNKKVIDQNDEIMAQDEELKVINEDLSLVNNELEDRVSERTAELKNLNERLSNYSHRLEQYANLTAHNLRSPLANIMGLVNVYNVKNLSDEEKDLTVQRMNKSAEEMDDVIQELSALMDVETVKKISHEWVNLNELVISLEKWLNEKAKSIGSIITCRIDVTEMFVIKPFLERTLRELLINSYHYRNTERALNIKLTIKENAGNIEINVEDNGTGIDLEQFGSKIFKLHQRFHERTNGRGVGLYLVKRQVEALNGSVKVESTPGSGTRFTILLPHAEMSVH